MELDGKQYVAISVGGNQAGGYFEGVRPEKGMVSFAAQLNPDDSAAIRAYLIARANTLLAAQGTVVAPAEPAAQDVHVENN